MPPLIDQVEDFDWLPWIEEKIIVKHGVQPYEVEECFFDPNYKTRRTKNDTYQLFSRSESGRYLFIIFAWRGRVVRIISARNMTNEERLIYRRK